MHLEYLAAATFTHDEAVFDTGRFWSTAELLLVNSHEELLSAVVLFISKAGTVPETYETRI